MLGTRSLDPHPYRIRTQILAGSGLRFQTGSESHKTNADPSHRFAAKGSSLRCCNNRGLAGWQAAQRGGGLEGQVQQDADGAQPRQGPVQVYGD
jgi:hypothetical protein